jgi:hypothetical protein
MFLKKGAEMIRAFNWVANKIKRIWISFKTITKALLSKSEPVPEKPSLDESISALSGLLDIVSKLEEKGEKQCLSSE